MLILQIFIKYLASDNIFAYQFCLDNASKDFRSSKSIKTSFDERIYEFFVA